MLAAEGYEFERTCGAPDSDMVWNERVMVVRSPMHATQQAAGLETRLRHAETKLAALTPPRGRGKRQITDEATLLEAIALVLTEHRVEGLLSVTWEKQVEQTTQYVGRGRGSVSREKRVVYLLAADNSAGPIWRRPHDVNWPVMTSHIGFPRPRAGRVLCP